MMETRDLLSDEPALLLAGDDEVDMDVEECAQIGLVAGMR